MGWKRGCRKIATRFPSERIARVFGDQPSIGQLTAGLRSLAQIGDPRDDIRRGQISMAQTEAIAGLYGQAASGQVIIERALSLEARLRTLEKTDYAPIAAKATYARVEAELNAKKIKAPDAIEALEKLRYRWRGDDLELMTLRKLGSLMSHVTDLIARKLAGPERSVLDDSDLGFHQREYERLRGHWATTAARSISPG